MRHRIIILAVTLFLGVSCSDFLELQPENQINDQSFYLTENDYEAAIVGPYANLQNLHNSAFLYLTELPTDNTIVTLQSPGVSELECDEVRFTSTNGYVNTMWSSSYNAISRCNNILVRVESSGISDEAKRKYKGEALFLRAYCYFNLVRLFGPVSIVETSFNNPGEVADFDMTRKPESEVYALIVRDLTEAAGLLTDVSGLGKGRASSGAAYALLGKVYLTLKQYDLAEDALWTVIDSKQYTLVPNYKSLFTNSNDDLSESIFEIKYLTGSVGEGNSFGQQLVPALYGGMALFPGNQLGGGRLSPTPNMANAYEAGDLRKKASVSDSIPLSDGTVYRMLYGLKFVDFTASNVADMDINFTALRYADVLLMYAEVLNETNRTELAHGYLNPVRNRAGLGSLSGLSKADFTLTLEKERRVEFLYEGHRWFDLVRTGRAQAVINAYFAGSNLSYSVEDYELLMPIPQREIDVDPELEQNPDY